jgi:hypothetical protein
MVMMMVMMDDDGIADLGHSRCCNVAVRVVCHASSSSLAASHSWQILQQTEYLYCWWTQDATAGVSTATAAATVVNRR